MAQILLIEPDRILADIYAEMFKQAGHKAQTTGGAQAAINAADGRQPSVVVLELLLGGHNGIEFLYEFRSYPEWRSIPVIINTALPPGEFRSHQLLWQQLDIAAYHYKAQTTLKQLLGSVNGLIASLAL